MGKRGPKPKSKVHIEWSPDFAYAIGLLATDGSVSKNGRHIIFVSKDLEQINNFKKALKIRNSLSYTKSEYTGRLYPRVQFSDSVFWEFLVSIGVTPNKSKTIGELAVPKEYFMDFLRGSFDGDGCFHSYYDPRWKSSFMFYTIFVSASRSHIDWLRSTINAQLGLTGHVTTNAEKSLFQLKYAKRESLKILKNMYYSESAIHLSRKKKKIEKALKIAGIDK